MTKLTRPDGSATWPEILNLLERLNQGFARHDVQQILDLFAPDPQIVFIGSEADETAIGPTQLRTLLEGLFARPETYQWRWGQPHLGVTGHLAWLSTEAVLLIEGPERLQLPYRITLVLQRRDNAWLIVHYHGSEPAAVSQPATANIADSANTLIAGGISEMGIPTQDGFRAETGIGKGGDGPPTGFAR